VSGTHRKSVESSGAPFAQPPTAQPENRDKDGDESMSAGAGHSDGDMGNMPPQQRNLGLGRGGRSKRNCNLIRPQSLRVVDSQVRACCFFLRSVVALRTARTRQGNGAENAHPSARKCNYIPALAPCRGCSSGSPSVTAHGMKLLLGR